MDLTGPPVKKYYTKDGLYCKGMKIGYTCNGLIYMDIIQLFV